MIHDEVYATYSEFILEREKYVQLDTYGKSDRENPGKISQSIQFDRNSAKLIIDILNNAFNF